MPMNKYIPDTRLMRLWMPILVSTVFISISAWNLIQAMPVLWNGVSSLSWPETEGIVTGKNLVIKKTHNDGTLWRPIVAYSYSVAGKDYYGSKNRFYYFIFGREWAEEEVRGYETGRTVTVYYKPSNPGVSCLNPGPAKSAIISCTISSLAFVFFAIVIIRLPRKEKARSAKAEQI